MKTARRYRSFVFAILSLAFLATTVEAKKENAPGFQKKIPLTMSVPSINASGNSVTISWSTNKESNSSISITELPPRFGGDDVILLDSTPTTEHRMSVPFLIPGRNYEYTIISTDSYGYTVRNSGVFTTPI